jgi:hypothetical protein
MLLRTCGLYASSLPLHLLAKCAKKMSTARELSLSSVCPLLLLVLLAVAPCELSKHATASCSGHYRTVQCSVVSTVAPVKPSVALDHVTSNTKLLLLLLLDLASVKQQLYS